MTAQWMSDVGAVILIFTVVAGALTAVESRRKAQSGAVASNECGAGNVGEVSNDFAHFAC